TLESRARDLAATLENLRVLRSELAQGRVPGLHELCGLLAPAEAVAVAFELPWPWGGERFELRGLCAITYIVGPLGSGKTQLAKRLAAELPDAFFLGLD